MLYQYHRIIPVTYRFKIFGATLSDKTYIYVIATHVSTGWLLESIGRKNKDFFTQRVKSYCLSQMMLSQSIATIAPAACGLFAGALYRSDIIGIKRWRFPKIVNNFASRILLPFVASAPAARSTATTPEQRAQSTGLPMEAMMASGIRNRRQAGRGGQPRGGVDGTMRVSRTTRIRYGSTG
jgi:hypothetical protein